MRASDQKLVNALNAVGFHDLAERAATGEWNDYFGKHPLPQIHLVATLTHYAGRQGPVARTAAKKLVERVKDGDFDGTKEESDEWAASEEGQEAFNSLLRPQP